MGNRRTLADSTEVLSLDTKQDQETATLPPRDTANRVTTTRPSYSFSRTDSTKKPEARKKTALVTRPRSSSPTKKTVTPPSKTASQELASRSHQKAHVDAINNASQFRSKTSLTPRSVDTFNNTPHSPIHALNFSATSKLSQATTSSSNIHAAGEFRPKATEPASTHYPIDTIMEADKESLGSHRFGMENGFENSPMASLLREYGSRDLEAHGLSTETKIQLIIETEELGPEMIVDRGSERAPTLPRYHLSNKELDRTRSAVNELQVFLQQAARLIEERQTHFLVDPGDTLLPILAGTSSLGQMNAAWKALRLRIELGTKALTKYVSEYRQAPDDNLILSPLSTLPELYNDMERIDDSDQRLRYLYTNIPHHQQQLSEEGQISLQRARSSWVHVLPMPASIRNAFRRLVATTFII